MIVATSFLLVLGPLSLTLALRIPPNPCPDVFSYNRVSFGKEVFGRVQIPYDGASKLNLHLNASFAGSFERPNNVQIKLTTPPNPATSGSTKKLLYNVYFPYQDVIPRITLIRYNGKVFCAGPQEPLSGTAGVTNTWTSHQYFFFNDRGAAQNEAEPPIESEIDAANLDQDKLVPVGADSELDLKSNGKEGECGIASTAIVPLVLGGEELSDGVFPWLVAMFVVKGNGYEYKCTANLISDRHVVTAARCVQYYKVRIVKTEDILLVFGKADVGRWATNGAITREASDVRTHPEYDQGGAHGDVCVITLNNAVEFSRNIAPVCLWTGEETLDKVVGDDGSVAGWGVSSDAKRSVSPNANFVSVPIVATDQCLFSNLTYATITSDMTFCAGRRDGKGPCIGDSGAGFVLNRHGKFYLRGLASLTLSDEGGHCDLRNFAVFCDVARCKDWILSAMRKYS
ncbi:transmembrane protease serine 9-like isoform X2 [Cylas formicarius]|uniref:transmembrane protease serine 9-like isoform X2 n=1 Tax=Cylas formicarius TaxID=197179 RepID=UPI002958C288|nr:transmembrane protease serine 9-like isoform X2 [Cylas formicarius]